MIIEEFENLTQADKAKIFAAWHALAEVKHGMKIGIGTGSTAAWFVKLLAAKQQLRGLTFFACATSSQTTKLARRLGIQIKSLDKFKELDLVIDGADEFDGDHNLIKGGGGALLQEKMTARSAKRFVVITDASKNVERLGAFPLPVEVVQFAWQTTAGHIVRLLDAYESKGKVSKYKIKRRMLGRRPFPTDEGHYILDLHLKFIRDSNDLRDKLRMIPGVVETGFFLDMANEVVMADSDGLVESRKTGNKKWKKTRYNVEDFADILADIKA